MQRPNRTSHILHQQRLYLSALHGSHSPPISPHWFSVVRRSHLHTIMTKTPTTATPAKRKREDAEPQQQEQQQEQQQIQKLQQLQQNNDKQTSKLAALSLAALSGGGLAWDTWLELVRNFQEREGHCKIPKDHLELGCPLGAWAVEQRTAKESLSEDQVSKLNHLGFIWKEPKAKAEPWSILFEKLERYKERFGHASVVYRWDEDPKLANWVTRQRTLFSQNKLSPERRQKLEDLGFVWRIQDDWLVMYDKLKGYKEKQGDCNVPQNWGPDPKFGRWVSRQREAFKDGSLKKERKDQLDKVGFEWTLKGKFILVMLGMQDEVFLTAPAAKELTQEPSKELMQEPADDVSVVEAKSSLR